MYEYLLQQAEALVTSGAKAELEWYEIRPLGITELDEAIFEVCLKELKKLGFKFKPSKESRYKDKKVHAWKDMYSYKKLSGDRYTVRRLVLRDPDYSSFTGEYNVDIFKEILYQADLIDSNSGRVESIYCKSILDLCGELLKKVKPFFA